MLDIRPPPGSLSHARPPEAAPAPPARRANTPGAELRLAYDVAPRLPAEHGADGRRLGPLRASSCLPSFEALSPEPESLLIPPTKIAVLRIADRIRLRLSCLNAV